MHEPTQTLAQLRGIIGNLKHGGGSMTPSTYGTAQVLRFCPEMVETDKVVNWLLGRQQPDGGWGEPGPSLYRIVPTAAALLALHAYRASERVRGACAAGERFLAEQDEPIEAEQGEYLPVAMELILPRLLDEAAEIGLVLPRARFRYLEELGAQRRKLFAAHPPAPDSAAMFSWEAWGEEPKAEFVRGGGVGCNPAATAWWLHLDRANPPSAARTQALAALAQASQSAGILGVVPDAWPMDRFEQSFVLHLLAMAGLLNEPELADVVQPQLEDLRCAITAKGLGFSDSFEPDGDDTAAAVAALAAAGCPVDRSVLVPFERADHFVAYPFEAHGSYTVTARTLQALSILDHDTSRWRQSIISAQQPDGWWTSDKWNSSRLYGTCVALAALDGWAAKEKAIAAQAYLNYQHHDGGWGCCSRSTPVETAFGILALCNILYESGSEAQCLDAIRAARGYLCRMHDADKNDSGRIWICKDLFSANRIDQAAILSALLASDRLLGENQSQGQ